MRKIVRQEAGRQEKPKPKFRFLRDSEKQANFNEKIACQTYIQDFLKDNEQTSMKRLLCQEAERQEKAEQARRTDYLNSEN